MVEPLGSTALSLISGMLFSCPRIVEPLRCRYSTVRHGVWCGTVYDILCRYCIFFNFVTGKVP